MKLLFVFTLFVAIALAEEIEHEAEDLEAAATMELLKTDQEALESAASTYNYPPGPGSYNSFNSPPKNTYIPPPNNYVPPNNNYIPPQNNYIPPQNNYVSPQNNYVPPQNNYVPPQNNYVPPVNNYVPPQNNYKPPQNNYVPPQNNYFPPQNNYVPPQNNYVPPQNNYVPPQNNYFPPQNDYYNPQNTWTTTTESSVIKNEQTFGENGSYKYEYQIAGGQHVSEEGYLMNPNTDNESAVKKGFYSYPGPDGKIYTVTYWADETGFHAFGDHLPTPPPVPAAIQAALDKAEAEKKKPQQPQPPQQTQQPQQTYYPPQQQTYPQQTYYPPSYSK